MAFEQIKYERCCKVCDNTFITTSRNYESVNRCPQCRAKYKKKYNTSYIKQSRLDKKVKV